MSIASTDKFFRIDSLKFALFLFVLFSSPIFVLAAPPDSAYGPGETLDPTCSPGGTNCTVIQLSIATSTGNIAIGTSSPDARLVVVATSSDSTIPLLNVYFATGSATTTALSISSTGITSLTNLLLSGSTTLANFTAFYATTTAATSTNLFATSARFTDLFLTNALSVDYGGTGASTFSSGGFLFGNGTGALSASSSPTVGWLTATTTTATSTLAGGLAIGTAGSPGALQLLGNATSTAANGFDLSSGCFSINGTCISGGVGGGSGTVNAATAIGQVPYYAAASNAVTATSTIFISTASNVGIGTTTPEAKLEIAGNLFFSSGSTRRIQVGTTSSAVGSSFEILGADALSADVTTVGGSILIRGGKGAGTGFPNTGGAVSVLGGGALDESPGGAVTVAGGDAAIGGAATFRAGDSTSLNGGDATFRAGNGEAGSGAGGGATFAAGDGATAGDTNIRAGDGTAAGDTIIRAGDGNGAGYTSIRGGNGFSGGRVELNGGTGTGSGAGVITITGGTDNGGTGGSVTIAGGNDSGGGIPGTVLIKAGDAGAGGGGATTIQGGDNTSGNGGGVLTLRGGNNTGATGANVLVYGGNGDIGGDVILANVGGTPRGLIGAATSTPWGQLSVHAPAGIPSFVVGSSTSTYFIVADNGRVGIGTTTPFALLSLNGGANSDGTTWNNASSRSLKENFTELDSAEVLEKIKNLSITRWNYKTQSPDTTHIGPIAEDFYDAFAVGGQGGRSSISSIDPAGVALIGIQALANEVEILKSRPSSGLNFDGVISSLAGLGANIKNGWAEFKTLVADTLTVKKLCLEEVCITKTELQDLLDKNGINSQSASVSDSSISSSSPTNNSQLSTDNSSDTTPPIITVNGDNPATIEKGASYLDLGATVVDPAWGTTPANNNLGVHTEGDQIDTSIPGDYTVTYTATDQAGNVGTATRQVTVTDPHPTTVAEPVVTSDVTSTEEGGEQEGASSVENEAASTTAEIVTEISIPAEDN